ncbi:cysteine peptidase family C39 domain-containing protein [Anaerolineales bacterium HSG25]|nr:cysteine peptidase family C39 domain-containing protein [Anaerolineales bacterium HSG25]
MPLLTIEHARQEESAGCLAACTQMVLNYIGTAISQMELNRLFDLTKMGVPYSRLKRLTKYDVEAMLKEGDLSDLQQLINQNVPPILFLRTGELSYWQDDTQHAVVMSGYEDDILLLNDPAFPSAPQRVLADELMLAWDEFDNVYAQLTRLK